MYGVLHSTSNICKPKVSGSKDPAQVSFCFLIFAIDCAEPCPTNTNPYANFCSPGLSKYGMRGSRKVIVGLLYTLSISPVVSIFQIPAQCRGCFQSPTRGQAMASMLSEIQKELVCWVNYFSGSWWHVRFSSVFIYQCLYSSPLTLGFPCFSVCYYRFKNWKTKWMNMRRRMRGEDRVQIPRESQFGLLTCFHETTANVIL